MIHHKRVMTYQGRSPTNNFTNIDFSNNMTSPFVRIEGALGGELLGVKTLYVKNGTKPLKKSLYSKFDGNLVGNIVQINLKTHTKTQGKTKKTSKKHRFKTKT